MKKCSKCKLEKSKNEFSKNICRSDGMANQCKSCSKIYADKNKKKAKQYRKKRYKKNKSQILAAANKYYKKNKKKISEAKKARYKKNKKKVLAYCKKYSIKNKQKILIQRKIYRKNNKEKISKLRKNYYQANKTIIKIKGEMFRKNNKEKLRERSKKYYLNNKEKIKIRSKIYRDKNKKILTEKKRIRDLKRRKNDIDYKIKLYLRSRLRNILKISNIQKTFQSHIDFLGCSPKQLKQYLESKFQKGMTWNNYGLKGWHIDHIYPLSKVNLTKEEDVKKVCHYTNLQPLWAQDNLIKGAKIIHE